MATIPLSNHTTIDLPTLIDTRLLIQANSGGGKSWLIRRLLEQSHGKVQQLVIDLEENSLPYARSSTISSLVKTATRQPNPVVLACSHAASLN